MIFPSPNTSARWSLPAGSYLAGSSGPQNSLADSHAHHLEVPHSEQTGLLQLALLPTHGFRHQEAGGHSEKLHLTDLQSGWPELQGEAEATTPLFPGAPP